MPGVLTHFIVSLAGFLALMLIFKNWRYGIAFAVGQLIPDLIRVAIAAPVEGTLDLNEMVFKPFFMKLEFTHYISIWISIFLLAFLIILICYKLEKINKEKFKRAIIVNIAFFLGIVIHLILDATIFETNRWI